MNRTPTPAGRLKPTVVAFLSLASMAGAMAQQAAPAASSTPANADATKPAATAPAGAQVPQTLREVTVESDSDKNAFGGNAAQTTRLPADLKDVPQSVTIINQAVMQSQGSTSLASALRNVPGLTIGAAEGGTIGNNINLNGFSARTDLYLDGARDRGQYYRDVFSLDSIEVLMGPSSMLFGRGSTGGVINQITKKPSLTPANEVDVSTTTNGLVRTTADLNQPLSDTSAFRINAMAQDGDATTRNQSHVQDYGIAPSLQFGIGTPTTVTLSALLQHNNDQPDYGVPALNGRPAPVGRNTAYGFNSDNTTSDIGFFEGVIRHKITADTTIRNQTTYNDVKTDAIETAPQNIGTIGKNGAFVAGTTGTTAIPLPLVSTLPLADLWVRQQSHDRDINDTSLFNLTELTTKFDTGSVKHSLLAGVELGHDTYRNQGYYRNGTCNGIALNPAGGTSGYVSCTPLLAPVSQDSPANALELPGNLATASADTIAAYVNDTIEFSPHWKVVAGARQDNYKANIENTITSAATLAREDQTVNFTSWRGGVLYQPTPESTYYLSYSTSFNPSLEQLTATTGSTLPLPPEENKAYEAGGKWDLNNGNLSLSAAGFQITQDNARSQNPDGTYVATGTIRVNGARAGAAGRVTDKVQIFAAYTFLDATIIDGVAPGTQGKTPANTPKNSASIWTIYAFNANWEAGAGATYVGPRYANNTDLVYVPGYTRFDAMVAYHQPKYDVRLNIFNLTNKFYYDALIPSDGGRAVPGSGITGMLSLTYRF
jgi:catecholate siderophore receptor